jgi:hypothetical protein
MARGMRLLLALLLASAATAGEALPSAPEGAVEFHGTFAGERFWLRLNPPEARFGNQRMAELLYTPPAAAALAGAQLSDCPFLLLDGQLRLVAWNGRDTLAAVVADARGYRITRQIDGLTLEGAQVTAVPEERVVAGAKGWDERLAPLLLAIAWRAGGAGELPVYDFFGASQTVSAISWQDSLVTLAGRKLTAVPDASGRLAQLTDATGNPLVTIAAWTSP